MIEQAWGGVYEDAIGIGPNGVTSRIASYKEGKMSYEHICTYLQLVNFEGKLDNLTLIEYLADIKDWHDKHTTPVEEDYE